MAKPPTDRELFTRRLAADFICQSVQYVDKVRKLGLLPAYYLGPPEQSRDRKRVVQARRTVLFKRSDLLALLERVPQ